MREGWIGISYAKEITVAHVMMKQLKGCGVENQSD